MANNVVTVAYPNGVQTTLHYDSLNRLTALTTPNTGYLYTPGPTGARSNATELTGRGINWSYDGIYRLTNETISGDPNKVNGVVSYGLDPVGNRLSASSTVTGINSSSFSFNADDELASESYDADGNVLTSGGKSFAYDSEDRLKAMNGGTVWRSPTTPPSIHLSGHSVRPHKREKLLLAGPYQGPLGGRQPRILVRLVAYSAVCSVLVQ